MGVSPDLIPGLARAAEKDHTNATNPRPAKAADYKALLAAAME